MSFEIELDHVGIATKSIEQSPFFKILGLDFGGCQEVFSEKVKVGFFKTLNQANIELLEPTCPESPVARFLDKRGPGVHHLCFRVRNIDKIVQRLKEEKIELINEKPRPGAHNCRVVFIHPRSAGGVLVELSEQEYS